MSGTKAYEVKKVLVTKLRELGLQDSQTNEDIPVWYGYQGEANARPREALWVGEIEWRNEEAVAFGGGDPKREEEFDIVLTIEVHQPGYTQEQANDRSEELMHAVEALLANPRWTGLANITYSGLHPQLLGEGQDTEGRGAIQVNTVRVRARK